MRIFNGKEEQLCSARHCKYVRVRLTTRTEVSLSCAKSPPVSSSLLFFFFRDVLQAQEFHLSCSSQQLHIGDSLLGHFKGRRRDKEQ